MRADQACVSSGKGIFRRHSTAAALPICGVPDTMTARQRARLVFMRSSALEPESPSRKEAARLKICSCHIR
jgi:hypothetical protein